MTVVLFRFEILATAFSQQCHSKTPMNNSLMFGESVVDDGQRAREQDPNTFELSCLFSFNE